MGLWRLAKILIGFSRFIKKDYRHEEIFIFNMRCDGFAKHC